MINLVSKQEIVLLGGFDYSSEEEENALCVYGFVREEMHKFNMNIPSALIGLITIWHSMEYVHVIQTWNGGHWKINVDKLLISVE